MNFIRKRLSPLAMPQEIEFVDKLPKTRSGKIMRRYSEGGEEIGEIELDDSARWNPTDRRPAAAQRQPAEEQTDERHDPGLHPSRRVPRRGR